MNLKLSMFAPNQVALRPTDFSAPSWHLSNDSNPRLSLKLLVGSGQDSQTGSKPTPCTGAHYEPGQDYDDGKRQDA